MTYERIKILSGNANIPLAEDVCRCLGVEMGVVSSKTFADGEIQLQILDNVRGVDAFAIQPTCAPVEFHLFRIAADDRCPETGICGADHGSVTLLWIRETGSQGSAESADLGEADRKSA